MPATLSSTFCQHISALHGLLEISQSSPLATTTECGCLLLGYRKPTVNLVFCPTQDSSLFKNCSKEWPIFSLYVIQRGLEWSWGCLGNIWKGRSHLPETYILWVPDGRSFLPWCPPYGTFSLLPLGKLHLDDDLEVPQDLVVPSGNQTLLKLDVFIFSLLGDLVLINLAFKC